MSQSKLIKERTHNDIFFTVFMCLVWANTVIMRYIRVLIQMLPYVWKHADLILSLVLLIFFALSLKSMLRVIYMKEIFYMAAMYAVFYFNFYAVKLNEMYFYTQGATAIEECFPMFLIGICAYRINRELTMKTMSILSAITIFSFVVYTTIFSSLKTSNLRNGDMHSAYILLPHICLMFMSILHKPGAWNISALTVGAVFLLFLGNRGSLFCLGVCIILSILLSGRLKRPWLFLILSVLMMAILFLFGLLDFLYGIAEKNNLSLRIFEKLESGEITNSSGRDKIQQRVWEYFWTSPLLGLGLFADRRVAGGYYAHNIIPEIMIQFGGVFGTVLLFLLTYLFVGAYRRLRRENGFAKDAYSALLFGVVFKLFLSSSYLLEPYFFFTVGFAYATMYEHRMDKKKAWLSEDRTGLVRPRRIRL